MQSTEVFVKFLGKGIYGSVDLVKYTKSDGTSFHAAVKTSGLIDKDSLLKEFQILSNLKECPRIVQCFGDDLEEGFNDEGHRVYKLILEHASEGSLRDFMNGFNERKLPDTMIRDFTRMILEGLVSLHSHDFVHCDLKPANILVFPSNQLKICDFGLSIKDGEIPKHWKPEFPFVGTANYMSPESFHDGVAKKTLDLWSVGCIVLEMYTGKYPWHGIKTDCPSTIISEGIAPTIPRNIPCGAREFIKTCFSRNPEDRGSASELLSNRFLRPEEDYLCMTVLRRSLRLSRQKKYMSLDKHFSLLSSSRT